MITRLQYAMKDYELVYIDDVESGLKCGCICPSCGSALIAKKGKIKIHHFAHFNSEECIGSIETSLHMLAKEILSEEMRIKLPSVYLDFWPDSYKKSELMYAERIIDFDRIYLEKKIGEIIPDIIIEVKGSKLLVEIYVTHSIDEDKYVKIESMDISTLLIDLSTVDYSISKDILKDVLINNVDNKKWIYNKKERELYNLFKEKAKPFEFSKNGKGVFCPQYLYGWKGESSARLVDCIHCDFCFSISGKVNCLGYSGVSKIADLDNSSLSEVAIKLKRENKIKPEWLEGTQCKACRQGCMVLRNGRKGNFLGCSNYPKCKNTLRI